MNMGMFQSMDSSVCVALLSTHKHSFRTLKTDLFENLAAVRSLENQFAVLMSMQRMWSFWPMTTDCAPLLPFFSSKMCAVISLFYMRQYSADANLANRTFYTFIYVQHY